MYVRIIVYELLAFVRVPSLALSMEALNRLYSRLYIERVRIIRFAVCCLLALLGVANTRILNAFSYVFNHDIRSQNGDILTLCQYMNLTSIYVFEHAEYRLNGYGITF